MFNHSTLRQNVIWSRNVEGGTIVYSAYRDIQVDEELCISYGGARLWFKDADMVDEEAENSGKDEMGRSGLNHIMMLDDTDEE